MTGGGWRHQEAEPSCGFVDESFGPAHNQHLPSPRLSKRRGELTCITSGGSILDADSPARGSIFHAD